MMSFAGGGLDNMRGRNKLTLKKLLKEGLDPNSRLSQDEGCSLLHFAVGHCDNNTVLMLLKKKADPNIRSYNLLTPLHLSVYWDFDVTLRILLEAGGNPFLRDLSGRSAFEIASDEGSVKCLKVLDQFKGSQTPRMTSVPTKAAGQMRKSTVLFPDTDDQVVDSISSQIFNISLESLENASIFTQSSEGASDDQVYDVHYSLVCEGNINGIPIVEYLYEDSNENVAFLETRFPSSRSVTPSSLSSSHSDASTVRDYVPWEDVHRETQRSCTKTEDTADGLSKRKLLYLSTISDMNVTKYHSTLSNDEIRKELVQLGQNPGPVTAETRNVYLRFLAKLHSQAHKSSVDKYLPEKSRASAKSTSKNALASVSDSSHIQITKENFLPGYPDELRNFAKDLGMNWQEKFRSLEKELRCDFDQSNGTWREGNHKTSFNYLLLDPRITRDLPNRSLASLKQMETFIRAVFYIGKGARSRPFHHLYEAAETETRSKSPSCEKVNKIREIWKSGCGVVNLYCFQNVIPVEAYTREACMICALGLENLTNKVRGQCYGAAKDWPLRKKRLFGTYLLYHALQVFLNEGERQIRLADVKIS